MCGIAGFIGFRNDKVIKQFSKWLKHRGPDGDGFYIDDNVSFLNRRLAIIDIKGGNQPIYNEDGSLVIVYNGEIYNYQELRFELENKGHVFKTVSDTEVILHGYEEWGDESFDRLNGMFAVAIHDITKKRTILVRDHFGIKPLYFCYVNDRDARLCVSTNSDGKEFSPIIFSSEIKPIIYSGLIPVTPNNRIIYRYLKYRIHDEGRETFFSGIERLLPGEMMIIENNKYRIKKFTKLKEQLLNLTQKENKDLSSDHVKKFQSLLFDSIKRRLVSEVPVGTCLSGGLDSSTVVAVINALLQDNTSETQSIGDIQKTFSAVFPGSTNDEEKYIDALISTSKDIKDYKVYPKADVFLKDLKDFVKTQEEPTISTGPYAQYKVMEEVAKHVTVVLDGQGADEMMAGYLPYYFVYLRQLWQKHKYLVFVKEIIASKDVIMRFTSLKLFSKSNVNVVSLLNKEFYHKFQKEIFSVENNNLKKRLIEDIFANSLQSLLRYEDKNAMRFSIEGRVPFLDTRIVEYIFSLPDEAIIKNGWNKYILRESTKQLLPTLINQRRNKIGFTTPEYEWFKNKSAEILSFFTGEQFEAKEYVNQAEVVMAFKEFIAGKNDDTLLFWRILNLELWMREFFVKKLNSKFEILNSNQTLNLKQIKKEIVVEGKKYTRYPIRTEVFKKGDDLSKKISLEINNALLSHPEIISGSQRNWFVVVSEKVVAVAQGRAYFIWDIKPSFIASVLSKFVSRVPWGIGLGSPWTMQLAIREVGLLRILFASVVGAVGKLIGKKGLFYQVAGRSAAGIDGPTEYSLYPANVSAKLLPKDPQKVCRQIDIVIKNSKFQTINSKQILNPKTQVSNSNYPQYLGSVIIDANDIGQNVLGNTTRLTNREIEQIFKDNPMGQTNEQTPVTIVFEC